MSFSLADFRTFIKRKDVDNALLCVDRVRLVSDDDQIEYSLLLAQTYELIGDNLKALGVISRFLSKSNSHLYASFLRARVLYRLDRIEDSIAQCCHLLRARPSFLQVYNLFILILSKYPEYVTVEIRELRQYVERYHEFDKTNLNLFTDFGVQSQSFDVFLTVLSRTICNFIYGDPSISPGGEDFVEEKRINGQDWPKFGHSMMGLKRLLSLGRLVRMILINNVEGDFVECGVWRGGGGILINAVLEFLKVKDRAVFLYDSYEGLPEPSGRVAEDLYSPYAFHEFDELSVSVVDVKHNFSRYGLDFSKVNFIEGFFEQTLPNNKPDSISLLRLDGDMYSSTVTILNELYDRVSLGGVIVIDDFGSVDECKKAVFDFRVERSIENQIYKVDSDCVFWVK